MRHILLLLLLIFFQIDSGLCQEKGPEDRGVFLYHKDGPGPFELTNEFTRKYFPDCKFSGEFKSITAGLNAPEWFVFRTCNGETEEVEIDNIFDDVIATNERRVDEVIWLGCHLLNVRLLTPELLEEAKTSFGCKKSALLKKLRPERLMIVDDQPGFFHVVVHVNVYRDHDPLGAVYRIRFKMPTVSPVEIHKQDILFRRVCPKTLDN